MAWTPDWLYERLAGQYDVERYVIQATEPSRFGDAVGRSITTVQELLAVHQARMRQEILLREKVGQRLLRQRPLPLRFL